VVAAVSFRCTFSAELLVAFTWVLGDHDGATRPNTQKKGVWEITSCISITDEWIIQHLTSIL
jgi:hypothetical protein